MSGIRLNDKGWAILRHGGHDDASDDDLLFLEIAQRAPNMSREDHKQVFIALRMQYGEEALRAIRTGHVQFEKITR